MKISGFSIIRNGESFDYPYLESFRSLLPLVDELVLNVGIGTDSTLEVLQKFSKEEGSGKIRIFESIWPLNDPEKRKGGAILSEQTNLALDQCTGDWCIYLQADEVFHEADQTLLLESMDFYHDNPQVEALLFQYRHLYGSYDIEQRSRSAYRREIRAFKRSSGARSVGDAQSFLKADGSKLKAHLTAARVFHYGWVRNPNAMKEKTYFMDSLYHGDKTIQSKAGETLPATGFNYRYKRILGLKPLEDSHPAVMSDRIAAKGWKWDFDHSPLEWSLKDGKKLALDRIEKITGARLFEHRKYHLTSTIDFLKAEASTLGSLFISTFNMPRHLDLVLAALTKQSIDRFEIILCDDGSEEATKMIVEKYKPTFGTRLIHLWQENKGFRKCRILNEGLRWRLCAP
jgi:glycosyltransferase involved in cell wall biosynthesis